MDFTVATYKDREFLIEHGAEPDKVFNWALACEIGIFKTKKEAMLEGIKLMDSKNREKYERKLA